jgi:thymidylate synthase ThyX
VVTINARSLRNVFRTRLGKGVHAEYQALAWGMLGALPVSHGVLYRDVVRHVVERDTVERLPDCARALLESWPGIWGDEVWLVREGGDCD